MTAATNQIIHSRSWQGRIAIAACRKHRDKSTTSPNRAKVNCPTCIAKLPRVEA